MSDTVASVVDASNLPASLNPDCAFTIYNGETFAVLPDWNTSNLVLAYSAPEASSEHGFVALPNYTYNPPTVEELTAYLLSAQASVPFTLEDPGNAPTTRSPAGYCVDGNLIRAVIDDQSTFEIKVYTFNMDTKTWSLSSSSGITATAIGGSFLFIKKQSDGKYVIVYYSGASTAEFVVWDPDLDTWGSSTAIPAGGFIHEFFIDSSDIYHFFFNVTSFVSPTQFRHIGWDAGFGSDQLIWAGPAAFVPFNITMGYPAHEWNGKVAVTFIHYEDASDTIHSAAIAYGNTAEVSPTWTVTSPSGSTHPPQEGTFALQLVGTSLAPVFISLEAASGPSVVNNVYYISLDTSFNWDASDTLFYDYQTNPPDPNNPFIFEERIGNHIATASSATVAPPIEVFVFEVINVLEFVTSELNGGVIPPPPFCIPIPPPQITPDLMFVTEPLEQI